MSRRRVLTDAQITSLFTLPVAEADLIRHYTLDLRDMVVIASRRRPHNRLGFALQLCALRHPGRLIRPGEWCRWRWCGLSVSSSISIPVNWPVMQLVPDPVRSFRRPAGRLRFPPLQPAGSSRAVGLAAADRPDDSQWHGGGGGADGGITPPGYRRSRSHRS